MSLLRAAVELEVIEEQNPDAKGTEQAYEGRTPWRLAWGRLKKDRVAMVSLGFIVLLFLVAIFAPLLTALIGHGPNTQYTTSGLSLSGIPVAPGHNGFLLGTDDQGRDVLSRIIYGSRISLEVGVGATAGAVGEPASHRHAGEARIAEVVVAVEDGQDAGPRCRSRSFCSRSPSSPASDRAWTS